MLEILSCSLVTSDFCIAQNTGLESKHKIYSRYSSVLHKMLMNALLGRERLSRYVK